MEEKEEKKEVEEVKNEEIETVLKLKKESDELKEKLEQVTKDYKNDKENYFKKVLNESTNSIKETKYTKDDVKKLAQKIAQGNLSNLEYWKTALELKDAYKEVYNKNLFNSKGDSVDEEQAERVTAKLSEMVQEADGDSTAFNIIYNRDVKDTNPRAKKTIL